MSPRADTMVHVRRRLMALHHASTGVLPSEREAMDWDWLERALPERMIPGCVPAAWSMPLPSGRVAVMRICTGAKLPHEASWSVVTLLLEAPGYAWFLARAGHALVDGTWWDPAKLQMASGLRLPEWPQDGVAAVDRVVAAQLARGDGVRVASEDGAAGVRSVVAPVLSLGTRMAAGVVWSVGLPVPAPQARVWSVREGVSHLASARTLAAPQAQPAAPPNSSKERVPRAVPAASIETADPQPVEVADGWEPFRVQRNARGAMDWLPWACVAVMGGALVAAWWMLR